MAFFSKAAATVAGFAAGAALANKIGGIVSQTQQAFNKTQFGDVAGAASAAGYKPITKFKTNDFPNSPSSLAAQSSELESLIRKEFRRNFLPHTDGHDHFEGDYRQMINIIFSIVNEK